MNQVIHKIAHPSNRSFLYTVTILSVAIMLSLGLLIPSGLFNKVWKNYYHKYPKRVWFNKVGTIENYNSLTSIISSQPKISFRPSTKYYLIEVSGLECANCAQFHGYTQKGESPYTSLIKDYVENGKVSYLWIDLFAQGDIKKHTSVYCAGEQSPKKFFEYREQIFSRYNTVIDSAKYTELAKKIGLNIKNFETCLNSNRYNDRVTKLSQYAASEFKASPVLFLYSVTEEPVKKLDGTTQKQTIATKITSIDSINQYTLNVKPELDKIF